MDRDTLQQFVSTAAADLASVRSSLLVAQQTGEADLAAAGRTLATIRELAFANMQPALAVMLADCESALTASADSDRPANAAARTLDLIAGIEASLLSIPLRSPDFLSNVGDFVDASFDDLLPRPTVVEPEEVLEPDAFEIDAETLDIFREEAHDLLANIDGGLKTLAATPADQNALWEIRRNAHTFKGAAGIVGLTDASKIAHRMEDLLDKLTELRREPTPEAIDFLVRSAIRLNSLVRFGVADASDPGDDDGFSAAFAGLTSAESSDSPPLTQLPEATTTQHIEAIKPSTGPVVRVSLERLDELLRICNSLVINRSALAERFTELDGTESIHGVEKLDELFEIGRRLTGEMQDKVIQIRMVKFSTLETRLARAVNVTCIDEGKKATVEIENGETEIDTQHIDALIEPLLHLLKNAVVHGIELPDTRRLIGKPERGLVRIRIDANDAAIILSVSDDGAGIALGKLREKAVASGVCGRAGDVSDADAMKLIFDRGLTTAEKLDLNAGRGVGLSIVKDSIESCGGSVMVESKPQVGTTFTILLPLGQARLEAEPEPVPYTTQDQPADIIDTTPLVLVVDDSSIIRRQMSRFVEDAGFRVITANNGAEALELLLNNKEPDLILSDVEMPQLDGWQLLEYVKTDDNFGHIPVVMVTSLDGDEHRERALHLVPRTISSSRSAVARSNGRLALSKFHSQPSVWAVCSDAVRPCWAGPCRSLSAGSSRHRRCPRAEAATPFRR